MQIMLIDDERILSRHITSKLQKNCYEVIHIESYSKFKSQKNLENVDIFLLDMSLGDGSGVDIVKILKNNPETQDIPVIFISGHTELSIKISGLDAGGDDYLMKPFEFDELLARIRSNLRKKYPTINSSTLRYKNLTFETSSRSVFIENKEISLSKKEKQILEYLLLHQGTCISKGKLQKMFWKTTSHISVPENTMNVTICNLRKKIGSQLEIKTIRGEGYTLQ